MASAWGRVLKRTVQEFREDGLTDWAAALTYYAVLSIFPTLLVLVALIGVLGQYPRTVDAVLRIVGQVAPGQTVSLVRGTVTSVVTHKGGAGALLGVGLVAALWSASGYVGAFMRAANAIYSVREERPFWRLRPLQLGITLATVVLVAAMAIGFVVSGSLADAVGSEIGLGGTAVTVWGIVKWPVMALLAALMFSALYYLAPNVRQPRFRLLTPGGAAGLLILVAASTGFAFYVTRFGSYNKTYGTLGGVVVFLVWLWVANLALLFGLELDSELAKER